jgi:hypothetical protein
LLGVEGAPLFSYTRPTGLPGGDQMIKKIFTWLFVAFLIFFVAFRPAAAANATKWIGGGLARLATGFGDFFSNLF